MKKKKQAVIFDGDDTLWWTQPLYEAVNEEFYNLLVQQEFELKEAHAIFNSVNQALLETVHLSSERRERAMIVTYETLCERAGIPSQPVIIRQLAEMAQQVYLRTPQPMQGVHEVIATLAEEFDLFFYSAGKKDVQLNRLKQLALDSFFQERMHITTNKDDGTLRDILLEHHLEPSMTWIIGNSPRFEINPGTRLGLRGIWMHTCFWKLDLEDISVAPTFIAFSLAEAKNIVLHGSGHGTVKYEPIMSAVRKIRAELSAVTHPIDGWVIGTSPKFDINPAIFCGANSIWIPTNFDERDIEPIGGTTFVVFTSQAAELIIGKQSENNSARQKILWRLHKQATHLEESTGVE